MTLARPPKPDWDSLYGLASTQDGYFTTQQAASAGYSPQLLQKHMKGGRVQHVRRGIYRLAHYPSSDQNYLSEFWLWSDQLGVFSHETALFLQGLSDVLPTRTHLTVPESCRHRRLHVPGDVVLHYADVATRDRISFGPVPMTAPRRTLEDCARAHLSPEHLQVATRQALRRGLVMREELVEVEKALRPFGGIAA